MRAMLGKRALAVPVVLATLTGLPATAAAQTGGVGPDQPPPVPSVAPSGGATGGVRYGQAAPRPKPSPKPKPRARKGPRIVSLSVAPGVAYADGGTVRVRFQVRGGVRPVRVTVLIVRRGTTLPAARLELGAQPTGRTLIAGWRPGAAREGRYVVRLLARDRRGARSSVGRTSAATPVTLHEARFPVAGPHSFGDASDRYGAPRAGHTHAGQDILADEGTPLVAVRGGTIVSVGYGADAGYFIALHGDVGRDYFYAHLRPGTTLVQDGQRVRTGQLLGQVGHTGDAIGSHLHFEMWVGAWWAGGHTIDPLPSLLRWDTWS
jgi:murein DD-endopeptidase MepM/ murein hydrolase activator NlpD